MSKIPVAILGATGAVGQRFIALLENHPWFEVAEVVASERSAGQSYAEATRWVLDGYPSEAVTGLIIKNLEDTLSSPLVFSALPSGIAKTIEIQLAAAGHVVCSNAGAHRMAADVPLVIPEVNADHIQLIDIQRKNRGWNTGALVTNSNCTSMPIVMAMAPLIPFNPTKMHTVSMQAVSGAGYPGVPSLDIFDNVVPYIPGEEDKLETEPAKMLGHFTGEAIDPLAIMVSAACNRVPVLDAHLVSIAVQFAGNPDVDMLRQAWLDFQAPDIVRELPSAPPQPVMWTDAPDRPQPRRDRMAGNGMATVVGRLRECLPIEGVQFLALAHNTIRGAAGCSILNAELLVKSGYVTGVNV